MTRSVASIVGGELRSDGTGVRLVSPNPARVDEIVTEALLGDAETFADACRIAKAAQPGWAATPAPVRGRAVQQIGRLVEDNKEALARLITREIGKPYRESLGEVQEVIDTCNFFLSEGRRLYGQTVPSEMPDKQLFTFRAPVGVAAVITAGNFPVAVPSWYLIPALVCGNAVVWKPAEYASASAEAFAQLILNGGLPPGVFNMVLADGNETFAGLTLALDEGTVDKVGFTGSSDVGRRIGELCGRHLQSACLELGGKNPLVVMPDADLDLAVEGALASKFRNGGQTCVCANRILVQVGVYDAFTAKLSARVNAMTVGPGTRPGVAIGPMINMAAVEKINRHVEDALAKGAAIVTERPALPDGPQYVAPMVLTGATKDMQLAGEETFGPVAPLFRFETEEEAITLANGTPYGLASYFYTENLKRAWRVGEALEFGMVGLNTGSVSMEVAPFGGVKQSGLGREGAQAGIEEYLEMKSFHMGIGE